MRGSWRRRPRHQRVSDRGACASILKTGLASRACACVRCNHRRSARAARSHFRAALVLFRVDPCIAQAIDRSLSLSSKTSATPAAGAPHGQGRDGFWAGFAEFRKGMRNDNGFGTHRREGEDGFDPTTLLVQLTEHEKRFTPAQERWACDCSMHNHRMSTISARDELTGWS